VRHVGQRAQVFAVQQEALAEAAALERALDHRDRGRAGKGVGPG
jgi:hypothetical protein